MKLPRRDFLKTSLAASAAVVTAGRVSAAAPAAAAREYYELRAYRLKPGGSAAGLDAYLSEAFIPALNRRGVKSVGVFTELDVDKAAATAKPKADSPVWVLVPHASLESFVSVSADLNTDAAVLQAGTAYLNTPKASPAFDRIDTWLLRAFASMPRLAVPAFSAARVPTRIFEMRDYESHSERAALNKMAMFDDGETEIMRSLGMSPVFFGQAIAGPNLPHLRYITGAADLKTHLANWKKFGPDPRWIGMKDLPKYKDNMTKNTPRFLAPTAYSQL
ncbi:MAG: twin-arginine translocation signal domain-containing protein [Opitutaceae bacterium]|nr:twin-arginine translocation signal domain-containing protein [Opitutaceae bacterium]